MDIRECVICGKAIYGNDYHKNPKGYQHNDCPKGGGRGGSGVWGIIVGEKLSVCDSEMLKQENTRLKELNREMKEVIRSYLFDTAVAFEDDRLEWVEMQVDKDIIADARKVFAKAEGGEGE